MEISTREFQRHANKYLKNLKERIVLTRYNLPIVYLVPANTQEKQPEAVNSEVKSLEEPKVVPVD